MKNANSAKKGCEEIENHAALQKIALSPIGVFVAVSSGAAISTCLRVYFKVNFRHFFH